MHKVKLMASFEIKEGVEPTSSFPQELFTGYALLRKV